MKAYKQIKSGKVFSWNDTTKAGKSECSMRSARLSLAETPLLLVIRGWDFEPSGSGRQSASVVKYLSLTLHKKRRDTLQGYLDAYDMLEK